MENKEKVNKNIQSRKKGTSFSSEPSAYESEAVATEPPTLFALFVYSILLAI